MTSSVRQKVVGRSGVLTRRTHRESACEWTRKQSRAPRRSPARRARAGTAAALLHRRIPTKSNLKLFGNLTTIGTRWATQDTIASNSNVIYCTEIGVAYGTAFCLVSLRVWLS